MLYTLIVTAFKCSNLEMSLNVIGNSILARFFWEVQISSVYFSKHGSGCCEWFIVTADFGIFREIRHLLIFSLYRFEFHTKTLIFTVFDMLNFVLTKQHLREVLIFCFLSWKKSAAEAHRMLVEVYGDTAPTDKSRRE